MTYCRQLHDFRPPAGCTSPATLLLGDHLQTASFTLPTALPALAKLQLYLLAGNAIPYGLSTSKTRYHFCGRNKSASHLLSLTASTVLTKLHLSERAAITDIISLAACTSLTELTTSDFKRLIKQDASLRAPLQLPSACFTSVF